MRAGLFMLASVMFAQTPTISLQDALARAKQYGGQIQTANLAALSAREDRAQARANTLPSVSAFNQFIYTEGNGTPSGVFVANDGVHVYNEQAVVHQDLLSLVRHGEIRRAMAAEAIAKARIEVVARGLSGVVIQDYYAIVAAQRKFENSKASLKEAERFFDVSQKQEKGGEVAHADAIKAQIDLQQRQRDLKEAELAIEKARIALGILIFPNFSSDFSVVDDLAEPAEMPAVDGATAALISPDIKAATAGIQEAGWEVSVARYQFLPSFGVDFFYGIDANQFAVNSPVSNQQNLGYSAQMTLTVPVWNWGATRSKVKQAELKRDQAQLDLSWAQRTLQGNLAAAAVEVRAAQGHLESLRSSVQLAAESLRLTVLRYQAGEATALEVVDAQNTVTLARNANDDGLARYRVALANLKLLMGSL